MNHLAILPGRSAIREPSGHRAAGPMRMAVLEPSIKNDHYERYTAKQDRNVS